MDERLDDPSILMVIMVKRKKKFLPGNLTRSYNLLPVILLSELSGLIISKEVKYRISEALHYVSDDTQTPEVDRSIIFFAQQNLGSCK